MTYETAECVKTGAHIWLDQYSMWAMTDMFRLDEVFFFKIISPLHISPTKLASRVHYAVYSCAQPWAVSPITEQNPGVIIAHRLQVHQYGYEGAMLVQGTDELKTEPWSAPT